MARHIIAVVCLAAVGGGCAHWDTQSEPMTKLPTSRMSLDSVALEIIFVHLPLDSEKIEAAMWSEVDEQYLPTELRRQLADNGMRCGLIGSQFPPALVDIFQQQQIETQAVGVEGITMPGHSKVARMRLQSRSGRRNEIVIASQTPQAVVLIRENDRVRGQTYPQAESKFALKTFPQGDGQVRLLITPEIHFGQTQQRWIGQEGAFRLDASRERQVFADLRIQSTLSPGQTLLLSCTAEIKGVGKQFFCVKTDDGVRRKLLLIRLAQTQYDDLFAPMPAITSLATPTE